MVTLEVPPGVQVPLAGKHCSTGPFCLQYLLRVHMLIQIHLPKPAKPEINMR